MKIISTQKKTNSRNIVSKPNEIANSSDTKNLRKSRDKTINNFIYNIFFVGYFLFVNFIVNFNLFVAIKSSGKLATKSNANFLIAFRGSKIKTAFKNAHTRTIFGPISKTTPFSIE